MVKTIEQALNWINWSCKESVIKIDEMSDTKENVVSTGLCGLDKALGVGGIRRGGIVEIAGKEGAGKTALALYLAKQYQKNDEAVLYIDAERTLTKETALGAGIEPDSFYILHENIIEKALNVCADTAGAFGLIIIDSLAALCTSSNEIGNVKDAAASILSRAMPILVEKLGQQGTTLIIVNQFRDKVGVLFGTPTTTTGGNALKYYSMVRLEVSKSKVLKRQDDIYGMQSRVKVAKNKIAEPYKETGFSIIWGQGVVADGYC